MLLNKTEARVQALGQIKSGLVRYDPANADYYMSGEEVGQIGQTRISGAQRRIFAELRMASLTEVLKPESDALPLVRLTQAGDDIAHEWGID